jgi:hypothetical protein
MLSNLREECRFINATIIGIEGDELDDISQASPKFSQDRIDVPDYHLRLSGQIVCVQRIAGGRLIHLTAHKGHFTRAHAVFESKVWIPVPVTLWPGIATVRHRVLPLSSHEVISG